MAVLLGGLAGRAETTNAFPDGTVILQRLLANRPAKDFSLKARMIVDRDAPVPVDVLVKNTATESRTIYRNEKLHVLVIDPVHGEPRWFLKGKGELTGEQRTAALLGSSFSYYDLALPFRNHRGSPRTGSITSTWSFSLR